MTPVSNPDPNRSPESVMVERAVIGLRAMNPPPGQFVVHGGRWRRPTLCGEMKETCWFWLQLHDQMGGVMHRRITGPTANSTRIRFLRYVRAIGESEVSE